VHRDVKPSNVVYNSKSKLAKLIDFGVARVLTSPRHTRTGEKAPWTFGFSAPEEEKTFASDVFSFGRTIDDLLERVTVPLDDPRVVALNEIVERCVQKRPEDRYRSAQALRDELAWARRPSEVERIAAVPIGAVVATTASSGMVGQPPVPVGNTVTATETVKTALDTDADLASAKAGSKVKEAVAELIKVDDETRPIATPVATPQAAPPPPPATDRRLTMALVAAAVAIACNVALAVWCAQLSHRIDALEQASSADR